MLNHRWLLFSMMVGLTVWVRGSAYGQIYSSMYFSQEVIAQAFLQFSTDPVVSAAVPIQQTAVASTTYGGFCRALYNVTDNGSVAAFDISASGALTPSDDGVGEEDYDKGGGDVTAFSFTVPVRYSVLLSASGAGTFDFYLSGGAYINTGFTDSTRAYTGLIPADDVVNLSENWGINNYSSGNPTYQSGGDSIQMTFTPLTPIPEPSSAMLIGLPALALLARRPRPARRRLD